MKGLLEQDKALQIEALQGLIEASKKLGLDPTRYRNALKILRPDLVKSTSPSGRTETKKRPPAPGKRSGKKYLKLRESGVEKGYLVLKFSEAPEKRNLKQFVLKRKGSVLHVFDLSPVRLSFSIKRIKGEGFKEIRIAQYDPKKIRIVVETSSLYRPKAAIVGNTLKISLPTLTGKRTAAGKKRTAAKQKAKRSDDRPKPAAAVKERVAAPGGLASSTLRRYTVVIDPGHGGKDGGAVGYQKRREKDAVLAVAKRLKKVLEKRGFHVYLTRERDIFIPLKRRTRFANRKQADFFVSIHANAAAKKRNYLKNRGIETYFLSPAKTGRAKRVAAIENRAEIKNIDRYTKDAVLSMLNREKIIESNKLAIDLQKQMLASVRRKYKDVVDNGVRKGPFWVLVGAQMPAVLIEIGYITHPTEARRLFNPYYQKLLAEGIANGIESYIYHKDRSY